MKKTLSALAALLVLTSALASCGSAENNEEPAGSSEEVTTAAETTEEAEVTDAEAETSEAETTTASTTKAAKSTKTASAKTKASDSTKTESTTTEKAETSTKSASSGNSSAVRNVPGSVEGKWLMSSDSIDGLDEFNGMKLCDPSYFIFNSDGSLDMTYTVSCEQMFCIKNNKLLVAGQELEYEYDGTSIDVSGGAFTFDRIGAPSPDSVYGEYTSETMFPTDTTSVISSIVIDFAGDNEAYIRYTMKGSYEYDPEKGKLRLTGLGTDDEEWASSETTVSLDGDVLTISSDDGTDMTLRRALD